MSRTYGFHDAEVLDLSLVKRSLRLVLMCFTETDGVTMPVSIVFRDVRDLAIDGVADGTISKVNDDGSVIGLTMEDGRAHLLPGA